MSKYLEESYNEALKENLALIERNKELLARLEIAETELRKIIYSKLANPNVTPDQIILMADDALQQLRS